MMTDHVIQQRIIVEQYGLKIFYITDPNTVAADTLSRLPTMDKVSDKNILSTNVQNKYARTRDVKYQCPLDIVLTAQAQCNILSVCLFYLNRKVCGNKKYHALYMTIKKQLFILTNLCTRVLTQTDA